jgi:hypothetical protein
MGADRSSRLTNPTSGKVAAVEAGKAGRRAEGGRREPPPVGDACAGAVGVGTRAVVGWMAAVGLGGEGAVHL